MRIVIALAATLITSASAMADAVSVTSPDHARTYAYGAVTWHQFYLERTRGELAARITFSNFPFADANEPRTDQPFEFRFPGFEAIPRLAGLIWHPTQRFTCSRRAVA